MAIKTACSAFLGGAAVWTCFQVVSLGGEVIPHDFRVTKMLGCLGSVSTYFILSKRPIQRANGMVSLGFVTFLNAIPFCLAYQQPAYFQHGCMMTSATLIGMATGKIFHQMTSSNEMPNQFILV